MNARTRSNPTPSSASQSKAQEPRKGELTRERVLSQAAKLFAKRGYEGVSMEQLAKSVKLTKGALYAHFKGKYEIYLASTMKYMDEYVSSRPQPDPQASALENLEVYLAWLLKTFEKDKTYRLLMLRLFIEADAKTTKAVAEGALSPPVEHLTQLVHAYKPEINALDFVYTLATVAMLNPDMRKTIAIFSDGAEEGRNQQAVLQHLMDLLRNA